MSHLIEIKVPDIGGHTEVEVIEVMVKPGDQIAIDDALITLETDKATMEVPAPSAGMVKTVHVKVGSKISEGDPIITLETAEIAAQLTKPSASVDPPPTAPASSIAPDTQAQATRYTGKVDIECDVMVLGGGPGGYSAAFRAADLGMNTVLVERYAT